VRGSDGSRLTDNPFVHPGLGRTSRDGHMMKSSADWVDLLAASTMQPFHPLTSLYEATDRRLANVPSSHP